MSEILFFLTVRSYSIGAALQAVVLEAALDVDHSSARVDPEEVLSRIHPGDGIQDTSLSHSGR